MTDPQREALAVAWVEAQDYLFDENREIAGRSFLAGLSARDAEVEKLEEELKWRRGVHGVTGEADSLRSQLASSQEQVEKLKEESAYRHEAALTYAEKLGEARSEIERAGRDELDIIKERDTLRAEVTRLTQELEHCRFEGKNLIRRADAACNRLYKVTEERNALMDQIGQGEENLAEVRNLLNFGVLFFDHKDASDRELHTSRKFAKALESFPPPVCGCRNQKPVTPRSTDG